MMDEFITLQWIAEIFIDIKIDHLEATILNVNTTYA